MALLSQNNHLFIRDDFELSLTAPAGKSYLVKEVYAGNTGAEYATITIERTKVGYFRCDGNVLGGHLNFVSKTYPYPNLANLLIKRGFFEGYPVAEGETFTVSFSDDLSGDILIVYDEYEAGDITNEQVNGSKSNELIFVNYGRVANTVNNDGEYLINTAINPVEFIDFPFGKAVPSGYEVDVLGILYSDRSKADGTSTSNYIFTSFLKVIRERSVLFSDTKEGLVARGLEPADVSNLSVGAGVCQHGDYSNFNFKEPLWLPEGFTFSGGEELFLYWVIAMYAGTPSFDAEDLAIGIIERVRRV